MFVSLIVRRSIVAGTTIFLVFGFCVATVSLVEANDAVTQRAVGVLNKYCTSCHGPDKQEGGLRLDSSEGFSAGGESGEALSGATLQDSLLWKRVAIDGDMPPSKHPQLSDDEKLALKDWLAAGAAFPVQRGEEEMTALANSAQQVLRKHCFSCHGQQFKAPNLDVAKYETLVTVVDEGKDLYVAAGDPDHSMVWKRMANDTMPPKSQRVRMTLDEKAKIRDWIAAGAPRWRFVPDVRPFVSELEVQTAMRDHLRSLPESARKHQRYFTFTHLHNNTAVRDAELALFKAALSKALNSLTWESEIVVPKPVDTHQTVYAVDLRDLDWTVQNHWNKLFDKNRRQNDEQHLGYPYGLEFEDRQLEDLAAEIKTLSQAVLPLLRVRADWFVVKASRPPLYHELLELPATAAELETRLEVTAVSDWQTNDLVRGGVIQSKVSTSNRLLDRHRSLHGSYWISYDFATSTGNGDLTEKPLGPTFTNHPFEERTFRQDGGEIVFTLPNGLNGYLLVDGQGNRIAIGPVKIVSDPNQNSGTPEVVTGISCMACHKHGVVRFQDDIRKATRLTGLERRKIEDLFAPVERMNERLAKDETRFLTALLEAVKPFLQVSTVDELRNLPDEPVSAMAQFYYADLTAQAAAAELGYSTAEDFQGAIKQIRDVQIVGPLKNGGVIKRERWENRTGANSGFQTVADDLGIGISVN